MALRLVTAPADFLLTRAEAKAACNVIDFVDDDDLIDGFIAAAQDIIEAETQRRYCAQKLEWVLDGLAPVILPLAPGGDCSKISVDFVKYADLATGVMTTLDPTQYWARPCGATLKIVPRRFVYWPFVGDAAEPVVVRFSITSTPADAAPKAKLAAKLLVAHFYEHREAVVGVDARDSSTPLPLGVETALTGERWEAPPL